MKPLGVIFATAFYFTTVWHLKTWKTHWPSAFLSFTACFWPILTSLWKTLVGLEAFFEQMENLMMVLSSRIIKHKRWSRKKKKRQLGGMRLPLSDFKHYLITAIKTHSCISTLFMKSGVNGLIALRHTFSHLMGLLLYEEKCDWGKRLTLQTCFMRETGHSCSINILWWCLGKHTG